MIDYFRACLEKLGNDLGRYSVRESCDNEIGIFCDLFRGKVFALIVDDASEFGIYLGIRLSCESLACKMAESEEGMSGKTSYELRSDISRGSDNRNILYRFSPFAILSARKGGQYPP